MNNLHSGVLVDLLINGEKRNEGGEVRGRKKGKGLEKRRGGGEVE